MTFSHFTTDRSRIHSNTNTISASSTRTIAATLTALVLVLSILVSVRPIPASAATIQGACNCVIFRLDDVQDFYLNTVQIGVTNHFINSNEKLTLGIELHPIGSDTSIVNMVSQAAASGKVELASHSYDHVDFTTLTLQQQETNLQQANQKMVTLWGVSPPTFIAPFNVYNSNTLTALQALGMKTISAEFDGEIPSVYNPDNPTSPTNKIYRAIPNSNIVDTNGIYHLPQAIGWYDYQPAIPVKNSVATVESAIDNTISFYGYAVVTLHPPDFAVKDSNQNASNQIDSNELADLDTVFNYIHAHGYTTSTFSETVNAAPRADTIAPTGTITSPASGATVQLNVPISVTGTASDNIGVASVEVRAVNSAGTAGTTYALATTSDSFAHWSYKLTIPDATYTNIVARIKDAAGNTVWITRPVVTTTGSPGPDTTPPQVTIESPSAGAAITLNSTLTVQGTASDNVAISKVEVRATTQDGSVGTTYAQATLSGNSWTYNNLPMTNSAYTKVVARATDTSGNQQWATVTVTIQ